MITDQQLTEAVAAFREMATDISRTYALGRLLGSASTRAYAPTALRIATSALWETGPGCDERPWVAFVLGWNDTVIDERFTVTLPRPDTGDPFSAAVASVSAYLAAQH